MDEVRDEIGEIPLIIEEFIDNDDSERKWGFSIPSNLFGIIYFSLLKHLEVFCWRPWITSNWNSYLWYELLLRILYYITKLLLKYTYSHLLQYSLENWCKLWWRCRMGWIYELYSPWKLITESYERRGKVW